MTTTINRSRQLKATAKAVAIMLAVLLVAKFSVFLLQAAILGLISVLGFHLALASFPKVKAFILGYKGIIDVFISISTLILAIKMGITAAASMAFAGVFFSLYLEIFANNTEKRKFQIVWRKGYGISYPTISFYRFY